MTRHLHRFMLLLGGLLLVPQGAALAEVSYFQQGNEAAVVALLKPHTDEDLVLGPWTLATLDVGPACELRFGFAKGTGEPEIVATLTPATEGKGSFAYAWTPSRPDDLGGAFEGLIATNDPGGFFTDRCAVPPDPVKGGVDDDETVEELVAAWVPTPAAGLWVAALVLALAGVVLLGWKSRKKKGPTNAKVPQETPPVEAPSEEPVPEEGPAEETSPEETPPPAAPGG
jgi:hypothetical protein